MTRRDFESIGGLLLGLGFWAGVIWYFGFTAVQVFIGKALAVFVAASLGFALLVLVTGGM